MRYVILNSDDFGYSDAVNRAVILAHQAGTLTSASLMVAEPGYGQAVEMALANPGLGVGLHVTVTHDRALLPDSVKEGLAGADGRFGADPFKVGLRYAFSRSISAPLYREMESQFLLFAKSGLTWSHADGHQHFHLHPQVWRHFIDLCDLHGVTRLRLPHEDILAHMRSSGDRSIVNVAGLLAFRALRRKAIRELEARSRKSGVSYFYCDRVYGMLQTGNMNSNYLQALIPRIPQKVKLNGTCEIYFHPASPHARPLPGAESVSNAATSPGYPQIADVELQALLQPGFAQNLKAAGICTGTYAEVESMSSAHYAG